MKRILYVQYTNPAGYPPLEHSSRILADSGWQVLFLGTGAQGADALRFPPHSNISVRSLKFCLPGWRQKLHYFFFCLWVLIWVAVWRPRWIYASDAMACPSALALSYLPGLRVLYHEHDSPTEAAANGFQHLILSARTKLARRAQLCILPNQTRLERFKAETRTSTALLCVWNCPSRHEVAPLRKPLNGSLWLLYHGSIVPDRLPLAVIAALAQLPDRVKLRLVGYETVGSAGYVKQLQAYAQQFGIGHRLDVVGTLPQRSDLMEQCRKCDVGLALMPLHVDDPNLRTMTGASNKAFDYLASGLALLVSDLPDWRAAYVDPGYGIACDPDDAGSIAGAIHRFLNEPAMARSMGERGRQRILDGWNYEAYFDPIRQHFQGRQIDSQPDTQRAAELPVK